MDTQITELSLEQLDQLFDENPSPLPTADDLPAGVESEDTEPEPSLEPSINRNEGTGIEEAPEGLLDDENLSDEDGEVDEDSTETPENPEIKELLTNTVNYLVDKGLWVDFEGREDLEITQEVWAELSAKQAQFTASQMFNELLDQSGDYGKAIIEHVSRGGDPNEIIDIFKEQKSVQSIDTSTEEGKTLKIETYYKDVLGWKDSRVQKHLSRLIENDEVDEEFETVEESYNKYYNDKVQAAQEKTQEEERKRIEQQKAFVNSIKEVLDSDSSLSIPEKNIIASSILDLKHKLPNGQKVNDFYLKFAELQSNPKDYVELVQFIMDKEGYLGKIRKRESTKANKEAFNFIKGNRAVAKSTSQNVAIDTNSSKQKGTDFSFILKK